MEDSDGDIPIATSDDTCPAPTQNSKSTANALPGSSPLPSSDHNDGNPLEGKHIAGFLARVPYVAHGVDTAE